MASGSTYEDKLRKQYRQGCRRQILAYVIGGPLGILLVGLILYLASREAWGAAYAAAILAPVVMLAGAAIVGVGVARRRNRPLDEAFGSIGLTGKQLFAVARAWKGERRGRAVSAQMLKGPTIMMSVACPTGTRAVLHRERGRMLRWGASFAKQEPMADLPAGFDDTTVRASDEAWMRRLLDDDRAARAIDALLAFSDESFAILMVTPIGLTYRLRFLPIEAVTRASVGRWTADLEAIAEAIEHIGPAAESAELSDAERLGQRLLERSWWRIALGCGCLTILLIIFMTTVITYIVRS